MIKNLLLNTPYDILSEVNLSIILPIYNEEKVIKKSIYAIASDAIKLFDKIEILAVNDGSTDNTSKILKSLALKDKRIKIIFHPTNKGYGAALRSGIRAASYDWIFFTDADMQFSLMDIAPFIPFVKYYDFIVGFRKNRADSFKRKFTSWVYNRIVKILFSLPLKDVDCAFKLMRKSAVSQVPFFSNSFFVSAELMIKSYQKKFRIKELGVWHLPRRKGVSTVLSGCSRPSSRAKRVVRRLNRSTLPVF